jgi:sugar phosphate isomerase/epimerase
MKVTRRELGQLVLTAPAAALLTKGLAAAQARAKPDSKWAGVQVGMNVPYNYGTEWYGGGLRTVTVDEALEKTLQLGVSAIELRSQPVELFLGAPFGVLEPAREKPAEQAAAQQLRAWRLKADPQRAAEVRRKFTDAGVTIDIVKYDGIYGFSDPEMDYAFTLAKALGVRAISCELEVEGSRRVGQFADKHGMIVAYHGHTKTPPAMFETAFGYAKHNWANIDIGHFVAGNFGNVVEYIRQHHDRITHVHIKDRKANEGPNTPFGQGDTPIKDVLRLIRDNKWPIQATIEFEYPVPQGSKRVLEIRKALQYCKDALLT